MLVTIDGRGAVQQLGAMVLEPLRRERGTRREVWRISRALADGERGEAETGGGSSGADGPGVLDHGAEVLAPVDP